MMEPFLPSIRAGIRGLKTNQLGAASNKNNSGPGAGANHTNISWTSSANHVFSDDAIDGGTAIGFNDSSMEMGHDEEVSQSVVSDLDSRNESSIVPASTIAESPAFSAGKENQQPTTNATESKLPCRGGETLKGGGARDLDPARYSNRNATAANSIEGVRLYYFNENVMDESNQCQIQSSNDCSGKNDFMEPRFSASQRHTQHVDNGLNEVTNYSRHACEGFDDDCDEENSSDASGDTVVHNDCPPPPANATQEEVNRYYWEWCYGPVKDVALEFQGNAANLVTRSAPVKSCLSMRKNRSSPNSNSMTPRRILHHRPSILTEDTQSRLSTPTEEVDDATPKNNVTRLTTTEMRVKTQSAVKFGNNTAAEFDFLKPITEMTPIPPSIVQKIFPTDIKESEKHVEEHGVSRETARNVAMLAEWDDDFDSIIDDEDNEIMGEEDRPQKRGRKRTPYRHGRRRSAGISRPRKSRRESSIFSRERKSLIDPDDCVEMDELNSSTGGGNLLPFSVTIDPEEYTSPSSTSTLDSISSLGTPAAVNKDGCLLNENGMQTLDVLSVRGSINSTASACISPSTLKLDCNSAVSTMLENSIGCGREGIGNDRVSRVSSTAGKETPNSARTSSSTILRAVHASGALLPSNSPPQLQGSVPPSSDAGGGNGGLRPNQLKYSPSSSSGSSPSSLGVDILSLSDSASLDLDVMSLFTNQNLEDDQDPKLCEQLSIFSKNLPQSFSMHIGDLGQWIRSGQTDHIMEFMGENVLKGFSLETYLFLAGRMNGGKGNSQSNVCGNSKWFRYALLSEDRNVKNSYALNCFKSLLLGEMQKNIYNQSSPPWLRQNKRITAMVDDNIHTISSCIRCLHNNSLLAWSDKEVDIVKRSLSELQEFAKAIEQADENYDACYKKWMDTFTEEMQELTKSDAAEYLSGKRQSKVRKGQLLSLLDAETSKIKYLENLFAKDMDCLNKTKLAKRVVQSYLEVELASPISAFVADIHASIAPIPRTGNLSDFTFSFLDGSCEIAVKIEMDDNEKINVMDIGCFLRDGGQTMKLLQAILLGSIEMNLDGSLDPFPLRTSLTSMVLQDETQNDIIIQLSQICSRIDALVRSVRWLETESFCMVNSSSSRDVTLSISMHHRGTVIQVRFLFVNLLGEDWHVTTIPNEVKVSIVSAERKVTLLCKELQSKAQSMLAGASQIDPNLLRRICDEVLKSFTKHDIDNM